MFEVNREDISGSFEIAGKSDPLHYGARMNHNTYREKEATGKGREFFERTFATLFFLLSKCCSFVCGPTIFSVGIMF